MVKLLNKLRQSLSLKELLHSGNVELSKTHDILHIREGDCLSFSTLQQDEISNKQLVVGTQTTHHFAGNQFISHSLLDYKGLKICSMIIATQENAEPYLALSKIVPEPHKPHLCTDEDFQLLNIGEMPNQLYVRENTAGMSDWLNLRYDLRLKNVRGTSISTTHEVRSYTYSLYSANGRAKALEIERYASGECAFYATIFIPASEIINITHRHANFKPVASTQAKPPSNNNIANNATINMVQPAEISHILNENNAPLNIPTIPQIVTSQIVTPQTIAPQSINSNNQEKILSILTKKTPKKSDISAIPAPNRSLPNTSLIHNVENNMVTASNNNAPSDNLATVRCNLRMAAKLIDEAMRNDMRVVDVMRRAIGLGVSENDLVAFDLKLTLNDYKILADRYELLIDDQAAINSLIMEELSHFTGVRD